MFPNGEYSNARCTSAPTNTRAPGPLTFIETPVYINSVSRPINTASNNTVVNGRDIIKINEKKIPKSFELQ
jgi:hypothetical protein